MNKEYFNSPITINLFNTDLISDDPDFKQGLMRLSCQYCKLPYKYMEDFADYLDWKIICRYQTLSEDFMIKMDKYIDWDIAVRYQKNVS